MCMLPNLNSPTCFLLLKKKVSAISAVSLYDTPIFPIISFHHKFINTWKLP